MNAIGYIRISKKDQSTHSLEYQEKTIREYCERNELVLGSVFVDDGKSSYTFDRPDYKALEEFIKKHKKSVKYLVVFDHDRFSRNLPEALQKIEFLEKKHDLKVLSISEPLDIDTQDPSVFIQRAFKYLIANQELLTIRRRAKVSARHVQESGRFTSKAPYGYINAVHTDGKSVLKVNENERFIVEKVYRDYLNHIPHFIIHAEARSLGFPHSASSAIFRILNNPLYCGLVRVCAYGKIPEKLVPGIHEAIIPESFYFRAQDKLQRNKRVMKTKPNAEFPLKGVLRSPCCGGDVTAGWSTGKLKKYIYYRCLSHSEVNIPGAEIHDKFDQLLKHMSFTQAYVDQIVGKVSAKVSDRLKTNKNRVAEIKQQLVGIGVKIESVEEKLFTDVINDDTYKRAMVKFNGEKAKLNDELESFNNFSDHIQQDLLVLPYMLNFHQVYEDAPLGQKHALIREVFKDGFTFKNGVFRTPSINENLIRNPLVLKQIGLLEIEQPYHFEKPFSSGGGRGIRTLGTVASTTV
jgi:site-specific DNA recombinase